MAKGKKTGGRKPGTPNKATTALGGRWRDFFESPDYFAKRKADVLEGKAGPVEVYWLQRIYGKPVETLIADVTQRYARWLNPGEQPAST